MSNNIKKQRARKEKLRQQKARQKRNDISGPDQVFVEASKHSQKEMGALSMKGPHQTKTQRRGSSRGG